MSMYVYKDEARTEKLLARNAQKQNKDIRFYCPNPNCDAHMYIRNIDGVSASYFAAIPSYKHIKGCFGSSKGFNPIEYDEDKFEFDDALLALTMSSKQKTRKITPSEYGSGLSTPKPLRTIGQIYSMCKSHDCSDTYNKTTIGQMLLDSRSFYMYPKGVFGWRIIEGKCRRPNFYDAIKMEISLIISADYREYTFILKFDDEILFKEIKNSIFPNRNHLIAVAGDWKSSGCLNVFCTSFSSKKQLAIIK